MRKATCLLALSALAILLAMARAQNPYRLARTIPVGGEGGWDFMRADSAGRRLYVSHSTEVVVLDLDAGTVTGRIDGLSGVHDIAVVPEFGRGFITNGKTDTVTMFDLQSLRKVGDVKTGKKPDAMAYDPAIHCVFAYNGGGQSATVIDASSGAVAGTIDLGGAPESSVADGLGAVYVNLEDKNLILKINSLTRTVEQSWPLAPGEKPTSLAMDKAHRRLFVGCGNRLMVAVDADTGRVVSSVPIGENVDSGAFDPETGLVFEANRDGTVTVIHEDAPDKYSVVQTLKTRFGSKNMSLDEKTRHIFLSAGEFLPAEAATAETPRPRPKVKPGTFCVLEFAR